MLITKRTQITVSADHLWELLTEPEQMKGWMSTVVSDEPVSEGEPGPGFISIMKIKEGSKIVEYESEISSYEPTSHLGIILRGGNLGKGPMHVDYRLTANGNTTVLDYQSKWEPHGIMLRLMTPLLTRMARKNVDKDMHRLKTYAESQ